MTKQLIRKGARVQSTGRGKTKKWKTYKGIITKRRGNGVYVKWDGTNFEDEMHKSEIKLIRRK